MGRRIGIAAGIAGPVIAAIVIFGRGTPPQMGAEDEVFSEVDALFTAITARNDNLLGQCEERLRALHAAGKLPAKAWEYLQDVVSEARAGRWRPAAETLYGFMKVQRREALSG